MREHLGRFGQRGQSVSAWAELGAVWIRTPAHKRKVKRFGDDTAGMRRKAIAWAKKYAAARGQLEREKISAGALTLKALWTRYAKAKGENWRDKTARDYEDYAGVLMDVLGPQTNVAAITLDDVDGFRSARREKGRAHSQVRRQIGFLRQMLNWAEGRELVTRNRLRAYRYDVPKDERGEETSEYSRAELLKIAAQLAAPRHWRARAVVTLCGSLGARINAVLHLQWADVDLDKGAVIWRMAYDKLGKERTQPLTPKARAALVEAYGQRHEGEPWVFWAVWTRRPDDERRRAHRSSSSMPKGRPMHYNTVWNALKAAEQAAGVDRKPGRAFHGLRRMVVGDIADLRLAGTWVGQASLKVTAGYDKEREEQMDAALERMTKAEGA